MDHRPGIDKRGVDLNSCLRLQLNFRLERKMVHIQRVLILTFRFILTLLCLWFSISVSLSNLNLRNLSNTTHIRIFSGRIEVLQKRDKHEGHACLTLTYLYKYFLNPYFLGSCIVGILSYLVVLSWHIICPLKTSQVAYVGTEVDDLPLITICPQPPLKYMHEFDIQTSIGMGGVKWDKNDCFQIFHVCNNQSIQSCNLFLGPGISGRWMSLLIKGPDFLFPRLPWRCGVILS